MQVSAVRAAIAAAVGSTVVSTPPLTALAYVPDSINPPVLYVQPDTITFDKTYGRGTDEITFILYLLVSRADDQASQKLLDDYLSGGGAASVKAALVAARGVPGGSALGGAADDIHVVDIGAYRWFAYGDTRYLGAQFKVRCIGPGGT